MFIRTQEMLASREHTLDASSQMISITLNAGGEWVELLNRMGRQTLEAMQAYFCRITEVGQVQPCAEGFFLEHGTYASQWIGEGSEILAETHRRLIACLDTQRAAMDQIALGALARLRRDSPWEAAVALETVQIGLESTEKTLHDFSQAALVTVDATEQGIHDLAAESAPAQPVARTRSRKSAA